MERYEIIANAIKWAVEELNVNAKVVRVSPSGCKVLSDNANLVANLLKVQFCESVNARVLSSDLVQCLF